MLLYGRAILLIVFFGLNFLCYASSNTIPNKKLQLLLDQFRINSQAPAAVMSINFHNKAVLTFLSGTIDNTTNGDPHPQKVTVDNLFQIGSITKSFTAAIILQLEHEGKLNIDDSIADTVKRYGKWLPKEEYLAWKKVTIKQLLNMTSGIFDVTEDTDFYTTMAKHPDKNWTAYEILKYALKHKPYFPPGQGWHYSNTTYNILGILIEAITHHSVETEINQRFLTATQLNLTHTYFPSFPLPEKILKQMAHGYAYSPGEFSPPVQSGTDMTKLNLSIAGASGAMISNSLDITKWVRSLFTGKVVPKIQLQEMMSAVCMEAHDPCKLGDAIPAESHLQGFALGLVRLYDPQLGLSWVYIGSTPGYYSAFVWLPKRKLAAAMTISASSANSQKILKTLMNAIKLLNKDS